MGAVSLACFRGAFGERGTRGEWSPVELPVWPAVKHAEQLKDANETVAFVKLGRTFKLVASCNSSHQLEEGIHRYKRLIFQRRLPGPRQGTEATPQGERRLHQLSICVANAAAKPRLTTSEAYEISVRRNKDGAKLGGWTAELHADTVIGAYRGLETFSQLVARNVSLGAYVFSAPAPLLIRDEPRFAHRGLLLDTVRHFMPMASVLRTLDAMAYSKLNVLHWHFTDTEALPVQSAAHPHMHGAAWSPEEVYTTEDVEEVVAYAGSLGIRVEPEVDVPGHSRSWSLIFPKLFPEDGCPGKWWAMDPSKNETLDVVFSLLEEFVPRFTAGWVHLGGDEVGTDVWGNTRFDCWRHLNHLARTEHELGLVLGTFMEKVSAKAHRLGVQPVVWDEVWRQHASLSKDIVVQVWEDPKLTKTVAQGGHKVIHSPVGVWYLDDLRTTWQQMFAHEPMMNVPKEAQSLVLGGEAALWAEKVDAATLDAVIWPRAAAMAERLWAGSLENSSFMDRGELVPEDVAKRLATFRCRLLQRGVGASPLQGVGREGLDGPSSCHGHRTLPMEVKQQPKQASRSSMHQAHVAESGSVSIAAARAKRAPAHRSVFKKDGPQPEHKLNRWELDYYD